MKELMAVFQKIHGMDHDKDLQKLLSQQQKENIRRYFKDCKANPSGYGVLKNTSIRMLELMKIAALIISLVTI